jgi:MacB-like periplasmic core domain
MLSLTREYVRGGMSQAEAELAAHRHFGSVVRLKEQGHDIQAARVVEDVVRDVRHMGRGLRRMRALPGVTSAAAVDSVAVIGMPRGGTVFHRLGTPELPLNERPYATIRVVAPGYFRTLRIPVRRGREFTESDDANPAAGFVVNEAFARTYLSGIDPLTVSISVWMEQENPHLPIIGVVGNVSEGSVKDKPVPTVFTAIGGCRKPR